MSENTIQKGFLTAIAGKAFALAAVAAIALPLVGMGQVLGLPGAADSNTYVDLGHEISQMVTPPAHMQESPGIAVLQPIGKIQESYYGPHTAPNKTFDTHISFNEGVAGLATAAVSGAAGVAFAYASRYQQNGPAPQKIEAEYTQQPADDNSPGPSLFSTLFPAAIALDLSDGKPGAVTQGAGLAVAAAFVAASVAIPTTLTGMAVYDNFFHPDRVILGRPLDNKTLPPNP